MFKPLSQWSALTKWKVGAIGLAVLCLLMLSFHLSAVEDSQSYFESLTAKCDESQVEDLKEAQAAREAWETQLSQLKQAGQAPSELAAAEPSQPSEADSAIQALAPAVDEAAAPTEVEPPVEVAKYIDPASIPLITDCMDDPPITLEPIAGWEGKCIRAGRGAAMKALLKKFAPTNDPNHSSNELAGLIPLSLDEERKDADPKARAEMAKLARATSYLKREPCDKDFNEAVGRLKLTCDFEEFYLGQAPTVKRSQDCEYMEGDSCGECERSSDCQGFFCGCPSSRCVFGQCTPCGRERVCDEPMYETQFKAKTYSVALGKGAKAPSNNTVYWQFKPSSAFRKVTSRGPNAEERSYGETGRVIEHDTNAWFTGTVEWAGILDRHDEVEVLVQGGAWKTSFEHEGTTLNLSCNAKWCAACAGPKCKVPTPRAP